MYIDDGVWVSVQVYIDNIAIRIYRYRHDRERYSCRYRDD